MNCSVGFFLSACVYMTILSPGRWSVKKLLHWCSRSMKAGIFNTTSTHTRIHVAHTMYTRAHMKDDRSTGALLLIIFHGIYHHFIGLRIYYPEKVNTKAACRDFKILVQTFQNSWDWKGAEKTRSPTTFWCLNYLCDSTPQRVSGLCLNFFMVPVIPAKASPSMLGAHLSFLSTGLRFLMITASIYWTLGAG